MTEFALMLARADEPAQCLPDPFVRLGDARNRIAYVSVDGRYLADVNDDPDQEDAFDAGLDRWATGAQALHRVLAERTGATSLQLTARTARGARWFARHDTVDRAALEVETIEAIDPEMIEGLSSYGGQATLWAPPFEDARGHRTIALDTFESWAASERASWWISSGYKEPFFAYRTDLSSAEIIESLQPRLAIPIEMAATSFVPHRVRQHQARS